MLVAEYLSLLVFWRRRSRGRMPEVEGRRGLPRDDPHQQRRGKESHDGK